MEKKMENEMENREYIGIIKVYGPPKVDRTWRLCMDYIGVMEKKMETTIV